MKKKIIVLVALVTVLGTCLVGCKKSVECDGCGEVKKCDSYEIFDEKIWLCDECYKEIKAFGY